MHVRAWYVCIHVYVYIHVFMHVLAPTKRVNVKPLARMNRYILRYLTDFMLKCQSDRRPCCNHQPGVVLIERRGDSLFCKIFLRIDFVALYFIDDVGDEHDHRTLHAIAGEMHEGSVVAGFN